MTKGKMILTATLLSMISGGFSFLISLSYWLGDFSWFLVSISGLVLLVMSIFLYMDSRNRKIWGGIIFLYSNVGVIGFGLNYMFFPWGLLVFVPGIIAGALGISQSETTN